MNDNQFFPRRQHGRRPRARQVAGGRRGDLSVRLDPAPVRLPGREWVNGETLFLDVDCWHRLAERVGRLPQQRRPGHRDRAAPAATYEVEGQRRTVYEIDAQHVSPDLNRVGVALQRGRPRLTGRRPATVCRPLPVIGPARPTRSEVPADAVLAA